VFPTVSNSSPPVNQLLGVNDHRVAVGFYVNAAGNNRAYRLNTRTRHFRRVKVPGSTGVVAIGINNKGSIAGFFADSAGTHGFFRRHTGKLFILNVPGASMTQPFGVNKHGEVVGAYTTGSGSNPPSHGFTWTRQHGFTAVNDPHGVDSTVINGVSKQGILVGFYIDSKGNTDGMTAVPQP
jgi:hypothetical protein